MTSTTARAHPRETVPHPAQNDMSKPFQAFTSDSYGAYLDALAAFQNGPATTAPDPQDYLHTFTLVRAAKEPEKIPGKPETWKGTIAAYAKAGDEVPSAWVVRTTLHGDLEGTLVLSDSHHPL